MSSLAFDLRRLGGLATRTRLRSLGHSSRGIRSAIEDGRCVRLGRSWVSLPDADRAAMRAVALRGALGGESALRSYGIWVSHDTGLCVATPRTASRLPAVGAGEYRVWRDRHESGRWRVDVLEALAQHLPRIPDPGHAAATLDSALNRRLLTPAGLDILMARMPRRIRRLRRMLDHSAQSGLETLLRLAMVAEGWQVRTQVRIDGVGRVDLLVDGWLVIEADGSSWHDDHESVDRDRERNAALVRRGYRWHRFGFRQIMDDLPGCIAVIRALLAAPPLSRIQAMAG
ncbi:endonuclease domain-containing protein [Agromyces soli]